MGYERRPRIEELMPFPPHGAEDCPPPGTDWRARPWRLPVAPVFEQTPTMGSPPPPIAIEADGPKESKCSLLQVYYYRNGMPVYFSFHLSTESWATAEVSDSLESSNPKCSPEPTHS